MTAESEIAMQSSFALVGTEKMQGNGDKELSIVIYCRFGEWGSFRTDRSTTACLPWTCIPAVVMLKGSLDKGVPCDLATLSPPTCQ